MSTSTSTRRLFGGAITIELPSALVDVSTIREVPDTQEVFVSPSNDASYVIEILQRVEPPDLKDAARFHFDALAHDNEATASSITSIDSPLPNRDVSAKDSDEDMESNSASLPESKAEKVGEDISKTPEPMAPKEDELSTPSPILLHGSQTVAKFNRTVPDEVQILLALYRIESKAVDLVFSANLPVATETGDGLSLEELSEAKRAFVTAAHSLRIVDFSLFV